MSSKDMLSGQGLPSEAAQAAAGQIGQGDGQFSPSDKAESPSPQGENIPSPTGEQTAAGGKSAAAVSLGKFKDIQSLEKAYRSLQSEFTRKCQRLAELERHLESAADNGDPPAPPESLLEDGEFVERYILSNKAIFDRVLEKYLKELIKSQAPATVSGVRGMMPLTPPAKPRTIYEAGKLAEKMFKNQ